MSTIICTTGTSVGRGCKWDPDSSAEDFKRLVMARVDAERGRLLKNQFLDSVSAETKSLRALKVSRSDRVFLLHTDTVDGCVCAEVVADILARDLQVDAVLRRVADLQVRDAVLFRRQGVDALFGILKELTAGQEYGDTGVVLNVTGGFKAVVPYVTLFGLLRRFDVAYIFEQSDALIRLPPLPVQYDFERLGQAAEAIRQLREKGVMRREDFFAAIPGVDHADRRWYECLLEEVDDMVALSAVASHLLDTNAEAVGRVYLHAGARTAYEQAGTISHLQFDMMMSRVVEPLWRRQKRHAFSGTVLEVYKPGNTAERMAGYLEGRDFYVCELFSSHDQYERTLAGRDRQRYRKEDFSVWLPRTGESVPETEEQVMVQVQATLARKEQDCAEMEQAWREAQRAGDRMAVELEAARASCVELKSACKDREDRLALLTRDLAAMRTPWWRRWLKPRGSA